MPIRFNDVHAQLAALEPAASRAVGAALRRGDYILGEEVKKFEQDFARFTGTAHAVGVASGTDALTLSLKALGIGPGDGVIVPAFTFIATATAVVHAGGRPVFCDVDPLTFTMDPDNAATIIKRTRKRLRVRAIIPVHLFGQCADMGALLAIARKYRLKVVEDAAQAHGARCTVKVHGPRSTVHTKKAGAMGDCGCFSFYPSKNLGGFGDGGMVTTNNDVLAGKLRVLRNCGRKERYLHTVVGYNSRLDTVQACFLRIKLRQLTAWNARRAQAARWYDEALDGIESVQLPVTAAYSTHVYNSYSIRLRDRATRDTVRDTLAKERIATMIYYPVPLHRQPAMKKYGGRRGDFPVSEKLADRILALPIHPFLTRKEVRRVARVITRALNGK